MGFPLQKGIVVEAVGDSELSLCVGTSVHSTCKVLSPYLQQRCVQRADCLNALSFSLNEL